MSGEDRWRDLAWVMAIGAAYDFTFAVVILALARPAARWMALPAPEDPVYLGLDGLLLALLAALYALAAVWPRRYHGIAIVSAAGRTAGFVYFVGAWALARRSAFLALGLADLAIGLVTGALWIRARRGDPGS